MPLKPNELSAHTSRPRCAWSCVGSGKLAASRPSRSPTSGLSARSCALPTTDAASSSARTFRQPHLARRRLAVPHARLRRAHRQRRRRPACTAASAPASVGSPSGVPVPCASTQPDLRRRHRRATQRREQQRALRRAVGRRQARRAAVLPHRAAAEQRRRLAIARPQHERADGLGASVAVGTCVERLAAAVGREHPGRRRSKRAVRHELQAHRQRERAAALAAAYRKRAAVRRRQRRGARRVDARARALQPEDERQTARRRRHVVARHRVD